MGEKKAKPHKTKQPEAPVEAEEEAASPPPVPEVPSLEKRARERDEFLALLQRERAEFSNYRKRIERDRVAWADRAVGAFVLKLLPVLDDFDRALAHAEESDDFESFVKGIRLIETKIYEALQASGVAPFEPEGETFNPAEHEAMIVETRDDLPDGTVSEVLLKGYRHASRVLRAAQVKVVRNPPSVEDGEKEETPDADV